MALFKRDKAGGYAELVRHPGNTAAWYSHITGNEQPFRNRDLNTTKIYVASCSDDIRKLSMYLKETLDSGWIDRDGNFWGCAFANHDNILNHFFNNMDCGDAERRGWIHLHSNEWTCHSPRLTHAQEETLINIGRSPDDFYRDDSVSFIDVFPEGYPLALLPCGNFWPYCHSAERIVRCALGALTP